MAIDPLNARAASQVTGAIHQAAHSTGTSFNYLLATAQIESNLNPSAQAATSSARGLFQFIEQTWLATLKQAGPALGYGRYAGAIAQTPTGRYEVVDPAMHSAIMSLRGDAAANAVMAGVYTRNNAAQLADGLGRVPSEGELYLAHFLGPDGAVKLIGTAASQPHAIAADLFPDAAAAHRGIFYDCGGNARSVLGVYRMLTGRYAVARADTLDRADRAAFDAPGLTGARAKVHDNAAPVPDTRPLLQSWFRPRARAAVWPLLSALWGPQPVTDGSA